jgi:large subunit ribosomal protein L1
MAKLSKRARAIREQIEAGKFYQVSEAVDLLNELSKVKFKESIDVAINLGVDPRKSDQNVRGASVLPHGTGKTVRVAVFAQGAKADEAKEAGADIVGLDDLAEQVQKGEINFDVVIASPDTMRVVGKLGTILGPRGLMPNPKVGTVSADVATAVKNAKGGQVRYRTDKGGIIHCTVGQVGFDANAIKENVEALINDLKKAKPASAKGTFLKKVTLSTTMGPGLSIDQASLAI